MAKRKTLSESLEAWIDQYLNEILEDRETKHYDLTSNADRKALEKIFRYHATLYFKGMKELNIKLPKIFLPDNEKAFYRKRWNTVFQMIPDVREKYAEAFPNLSIEEAFITANSAFHAITYDAIIHIENLTLAAALWILDELQIQGNIQRILPILPEMDEIENIWLPEFFQDSCFDNHLILGVMHLIVHRNDDLIHDPDFKPYINDASLTRSEKKHEYITPDDPIVSCETNRQKFDYIISLLHPDVIERATKRFEEKQWEAFELYLACLDKYRTEELQLLDELNDSIQKLKKLHTKIMREKEDRERATQDLLKGNKPNILLNKQPSIEEILNLHPADAGIESMWDTRPSVEELKLNLYFDRITKNEDRRLEIQSIRRAISCFLGTPLTGDEPDSDSHADVVRELELLYQMEIKNPFELCFAFLYLLDSGSPMPWLVPLGMTVLSNVSQFLPWHKFPEYSDDPFYDDEEDLDEDDAYEDAEDADMEEEEDTEDSDEEKENSDSLPKHLFVPPDWIEEEAKLYERKYKYPIYNENTDEYEAKDSPLLNFPQFIYSKTQIAIPRSIFWYFNMSDLYEHAGFSADEAKMLEKYMTLSNAIFTKSILERRLDQHESPEKEKTEEVSAENVETTQADVDALKQENRRLKEEVKKSHDEKRSLLRETDALKSENESLMKQLAELRTMIRNTDTESGQEQPEHSPIITFPYTPRGRYVVFGGHASWARAVKPLLENVRFIDANAKPNVSLILHADTVWVQSNAIGHSNFYKIVDVVRTHGIKLEYFSYASAEKCAEQLALYDLEFAGNAIE